MTPRDFPLARKRSDWSALWILLGLGVVLMLAAALAGAEENFTATRTENFTATLSARSSLKIENVSGDIVASTGKSFSAVVTTTVTAPSQSRADEALRRVRILQSRDDDEYSLETHWPDSKDFSFSSNGRDARRRSTERCRGCKVTTRYELVIPPGVKAELRTVNGEVQARELDGDLDLHSVNGNVRASGTRRSVAAQTVNGKVEIVAQAFPSDAAANMQTINGAITLTLPKNARFDLAASTTNGAIASSFSLPARAETPEPEVAGRKAEKPEKPERPGEPRARAPRPVVVRHEGDEVVVDVEALEKELEESMKSVDVEVHESLRGVNRELRRLKIFDMRREYNGSVGQGGGKVHLSTLNGSITLLASGTEASDARSIVPERQRFAVTIPQIRVRVPKTIVRVPAPPRPVIATPDPDEEEESVVRGDVAGDFLATSGGGNYTIGRVSGNVKILTHSGEIHVASAGAGADLKTYGGDIQIGPVNGDLRAQTLAGDVRAGAVAGSITVETSGGDIRVDKVGGSAGARTAGGDIVLPSVKGGLEAQTGGGDVRVAILSRDVKGGVTIRDSGGDVTLTLPADFRGEVELEVLDSDPTETLIRTDFGDIAVTRQHSSQRASGTLNGGGPKVSVRTHSGTIRLLKGPPAGS